LKHAKIKASKSKNIFQMTKKQSKKEWENNQREISPNNLSWRCQGFVDYLRRPRKRVMVRPMQ
jgi:hypothetical protein